MDYRIRWRRANSDSWDAFARPKSFETVDEAVVTWLDPKRTKETGRNGLVVTLYANLYDYEIKDAEGVVVWRGCKKADIVVPGYSLDGSPCWPGQLLLTAVRPARRRFRSA